ncbi:aspartate 1-decarboxylase [Verrucomicrobia bacterium LW23]|nr:aspartate 1-decarboxylase [Verrucomicrobia bacterium LW23]
MRLINMLKSKLHRATVTGASLHYEGSLTISEDLARRARFHQYERILVGNINNGERFETYVIFGEAGKGIIELNGATAHLGKIGDRLTIMCYTQIPEEDGADHHPVVLLLDEKNRMVRLTGHARPDETEIKECKDKAN